VPYPSKVAFTLLTLAAMLSAPDWVPAFKDYHVMDWASVVKVVDFQPRVKSDNPIEEEQLRLKPDTTVEKAETKQLVDPANVLESFYASLYATERKDPGAVTRILHYGDSPTTADLITSDVRSLFQKDFGDAGHGFALVGKPWAWYAHRGLEIKASGWKIEPANTADLKDGLYGLGAVSFRGGAGAQSRVILKDPTHSEVEVSYLSQPQGGSFQVLADGAALGTVDTEAPNVTPSFRSFPLLGGVKELQIANVSGKVRLYGLRFSKANPGVEYNSLGVNGAYISILARMVDEQHWAEQLQHHRPNLVVINYGTNESVYTQFVDTAFERELLRTIARVKKAVPQAAILIMSPMDRGQKMADGEIGTVPALARLVAIEQRVAAERGCAFFNTFEAMGGPGTMGRWYHAEPRLVGADFIHPMPNGAKIVGNLLYKSLQQGYRRYKLRMAKEKFATIKGYTSPSQAN
jgi:lysophospholipase L1-like esterase